MTGKLGLVTIGQAPRTDMTADVASALAGIDVVEHGALDLLAPETMGSVAPEPDEVPLVSRLRDGTSVSIGHRAIVPLLNDAIERCERDGAVAILVLCTGHFENVRSRVPLYFAEQLCHGGTAAIVGTDAVGVMTPVEAQVEESRSRWRAVVDGDVTVAAGDPYNASESALAAAGRRLADEGARWIVLDCIGYTERMRNAVAHAAGVPVLLARSLAVILAAEATRASAGALRA